MMKEQEIYKIAKDTLNIEIDAIKNLTNRIGKSFYESIKTILNCKGRVIIIGMGKSGIIGKKISATFSSTGTPSFFMHPSEGLHGDLGLIMEKDITILISKSGETREILDLIPSIKKRGVKIISMTGNKKSTLARYSDINLDVSVEKEACPLNAAPTASTTATLVMGDALAVVLILAKGFTTEQFAEIHPGGSLGKKLFLKVDDIMHSGKKNAIIKQTASVKEAIFEITEKGLGAACITDNNGKLIGIITDGDLRRAIEKHNNILEMEAIEIATKSPITITTGKLAVEALRLMENRPSQIMVLPIINGKDEPIGLIRIHDLVKAGIDTV